MILPTKNPITIKLSAQDTKDYDKFKQKIESTTGEKQPIMLDFCNVHHLEVPIITLVKDLIVRVYPVSLVYGKNYNNVKPQLEAVGIFPFLKKE